LGRVLDKRRRTHRAPTPSTAAAPALTAITVPNPTAKTNNKAMIAPRASNTRIAIAVPAAPLA
jgi:hypothetical protein